MIKNIEDILTAWALGSNQVNLYNMLTGKLSIEDYIVSCESQFRVEVMRADAEITLLREGKLGVHPDQIPDTARKLVLAKEFSESQLEKVRQFKKEKGIVSPLDKI